MLAINWHRRVLLDLLRRTLYVVFCYWQTARSKQALSYTGLAMEALEAHPDGLSVAGLRKCIKDKHPTLAKHDTPQCTWQVCLLTCLVVLEPGTVGDICLPLCLFLVHIRISTLEHNALVVLMCRAPYDG